MPGKSRSKGKPRHPGPKDPTPKRPGPKNHGPKNHGPKNHGLKRRDLLGAAGAGSLAAATTAFPKPALSQNLLQWRLQTTWPKALPGLAAGANKLAELINWGSSGRLTVEVFGGGEVVPPFETLDAVAEGTIEMGHGAPYFWRDKVPAAQFLASTPFGLTAAEQNAWLQVGGGQELAERIYDQLGVKFFVSGNTGMQGGGWFRKKVTSMKSFKGLRMRIPGLGAEVIKAAGGKIVTLPASEIPPTLAAGKIHAAEWVGPYNDLAFGLHKAAKHYYYPGWHEPGTILDNVINRTAWEGLDKELQTVVTMANAHTNAYVLNEFNGHNTAALKTLENQHGVNLEKFPDKVLAGLGDLTGKVLSDLAAADPLSSEVLDSITRFRSQAIVYAKTADQAFYAARRLPFNWAKP